MRRLALFCVVVCLGGGTLMDAQQQPRPAASRDLPIRRVVLYKSGIGFFEHVGRVTGDQRVAVPFTSPQLDDVLKTLTVLDLDGGVVSSVGYASEAPLSRRLGALGLPLGEDTTLPKFLAALRGARVEVRRGAVSVTGRLLDVESKSRARDGGVEEVNQISVVTETGEVHAVDLGAGTVLRFADSALNQRVNRYLEMVASSRDQDRRFLTIDATGSGTRRLYVSYVSEVPIWKTTYRIVLADDAAAKPRLQGWAIIDNTVGDDWTDVELSLVAGAPQSFIQPLSQPLYARRPQVPMPGGFMLSPQTHAETLIAGGAAGRVVDPSGAALPGVAVRVYDASGQLAGSTVTNADGRFSVPGAQGRLRAEYTLQGFNTVSTEFDADVEQQVVMNVTGLTESVIVTAGAARRLAGGGGAGGGRGLGGVVGGMVGGLPDAPAPVFRSAIDMPAQATARDLGELFEYKLKQLVTVRQNQSAMVPIVSSAIAADRVSLWTPSDLGSRPLRALWVTNTSGLTLDGGSVAILDHETFAGEGLVDTIKPNERRLISYAADLGMQVELTREGVQGQQQRIRAARGVMTIESFECEKVRYTARNHDTTARQLVIEHPRREGWQLMAGGPSPAESSTTAHRFQMPVASSSTATLHVAAYRPVQSSIRIISMSDEQLQVYMRQGAIDDKTRVALEAVVAAMRGRAQIEQQAIANQNEIDRIDKDQQRLRENMKSLKGSSEEKQLVERYVKQLNEQEDRIATLRRERPTLERQLEESERALGAQIDALSVEPSAVATPCR